MASGRRDLVRFISSLLYMTSQLDRTDDNKLMQFCWISAKHLISFPIIALQSSSITMASEIKTYPGSKVFSRIEISKLSLIGRHHHIRSSTRYSAWTCPVSGIHQWPALKSFLFSDDCLLYRVIRDQQDAESLHTDLTGMGKRMANGF